MTIKGGCLCGAVRYEVDAAPLGVRTCWCRVCQYLGAGNSTVNAVFPNATLRISGELSDWRSVADSGNVMHRRFCPQCGTPMFSEAEARPHVTIIRSGTLDDPELGKPEMIIWAASAPGWACFDSALPRIDGQPPPPPSP